MKVDFNKSTNPGKYVIFINGKKAGLLQLLSHNPNDPVNPNQRMDWRVFFWGKYEKFQIDYRELGLWSKVRACNSDCTLNQIKQDVKFLLENNFDQILPKSYFEDKGYVLAHFDDEEIYTIDTGYQDTWSKYFRVGGKSILFASQEVLNERVKNIHEYEKRNYPDRPELWSDKNIIKIEYKMINPIFDTSYYYI